MFRLLSWWAHLSKQMGTICLGRTTSLQLSEHQGALASVFSAESEVTSGTGLFRGLPRAATGKVRVDSTLDAKAGSPGIVWTS